MLLYERAFFHNILKFLRIQSTFYLQLFIVKYYKQILNVTIQEKFELISKWFEELKLSHGNVSLQILNFSNTS